MPNVSDQELRIFFRNLPTSRNPLVSAKNRSISFPPECPVNTVGLQVSGPLGRIIPPGSNKGTIKGEIQSAGAYTLCAI